MTLKEQILAEFEENLDRLLAEGHGGGNWRRLIMGLRQDTFLSDALDRMERRTTEKCWNLAHAIVYEKAMDEIVDRKFPRGERKWCKECAERIRAELTKKK